MATPLASNPLHHLLVCSTTRPSSAPLLLLFFTTWQHSILNPLTYPYCLHCSSWPSLCLFSLPFVVSLAADCPLVMSLFAALASTVPVLGSLWDPDEAKQKAVPGRGEEAPRLRSQSRAERRRRLSRATQGTGAHYTQPADTHRHTTHSTTLHPLTLCPNPITPLTPSPFPCLSPPVSL